MGHFLGLSNLILKLLILRADGLYIDLVDVKLVLGLVAFVSLCLLLSVRGIGVMAEQEQSVLVKFLDHF